MTDEEFASRLSQCTLGAECGAFAAGTLFGDWRLTAFISRGGTSEVYAAEHIALGTPAAVKILLGTDPGKKGTDPILLGTDPIKKKGTDPIPRVEKERFERKKLRFEQEARLLAGLNSPHFPSFYAFGEAHGYVYLAEELLEPGELPRGDRPRAKHLLSICEGLRELHARGVVHRDLKPTNILFRRKTGEPVIVDLGLAKSVDVPIASDGVSIVDGKAVGVGTPEYAAPEQFMGGDITPAADIHALGVLAEKLLASDPRRFRWGGDILVAACWRRIIRRATSSIASERYQSVEAFAAAIRRRHWLRSGLVGAGVAAVLALVAGLVVLFSEPSLPAVLNLRGQTLVFNEPIVLKPGRTYRVIGPGTLDADISGPASATLWMTNCVVLNRAKTVFPAVELKYHLTAGVYLNFINIDDRLAPWRWSFEYLGHYDGAFNDVSFGGPDTLAGLLQKRNTEIWFDTKPPH